MMVLDMMIVDLFCFKSYSIFVPRPAIALLHLAVLVGIYLILSAAFLKLMQPLQPMEGSCIGKIQTCARFSEENKI